MADHELKELDNDPLTHLDEEPYSALAQHDNLGGCFNIIGPIKICYSQEGSGFKVCLNIAGIDVACGHLDPSNPCVNLEGSVVLAKASIEVCLKGNCLTYSAKACVRPTPFNSWKCTSASGNIICF